jgi:hypothetical protein
MRYSESEIIEFIYRDNRVSPFAPFRSISGPPFSKATRIAHKVVKLVVLLKKKLEFSVSQLPTDIAIPFRSGGCRT